MPLSVRRFAGNQIFLQERKGFDLPSKNITNFIAYTSYDADVSCGIYLQLKIGKILEKKVFTMRIYTIRMRICAELYTNSLSEINPIQAVLPLKLVS